MYLVQADTPFDEAHALIASLDFSRPVVLLDNEGDASVAEVRGAKEHPDGVLVIRDGEMFVEAGGVVAELGGDVPRVGGGAATARRRRAGPELHEDFLKEVEDDYVPDDTPEIDTY